MASDKFLKGLIILIVSEIIIAFILYAILIIMILTWSVNQ
jgi:hypothetical protein